MDYPKSVPGVGLVDGKFVDEDATIGRIGSLIPASWGNAITDEVLAVCAQAGIAPDETKRNQLVQAIMALLPRGGHGQCRLSVVSGTQLKLSAFDGNGLIIAGAPQQIPAAGVSIDNTGLAASTNYYVYAYMTAGGVMALEPSTTVRATDTNGVQIKNGDPSRTLVGLIRTTAAKNFVDSALQMFCLNWFNRRLKRGIATLLTDVAFTNTALAEVTSALRVEFLVWNELLSGSDGGTFQAMGRLSNNTSGGLTTAATYIDGALAGAASEISISGTTFLRQQFISGSLVNGMAEGNHTSTLYGSTSSTSQATLLGGANNTVMIHG
ncbi:hypothetical protein AB4Z48_17640 [Cupriavidus sp. 2TAF22]|uniref:hypothetical protein n=1 Tax=unclassified Cupriavidus TaxID=2640874 RepID=UPI003F90D15E